MDRERKLTKLLVYKSIQVIIQSREKYLLYTKSSDKASSEFLSLAVDEVKELHLEIKRNVDPTTILNGSSICVEISLETTEKQILVLETWCLQLLPPTSPSKGQVFSESIACATTMLKSLISLSRVFPAHAHAQKQGPESHFIKYRLYSGQPESNLLGSDYGECEIGNVPMSIGNFVTHISYRTRMLFSPTSSVNQALAPHENYFVDDRKPCCHIHQYPSGTDAIDCSSNLYGSILSQSPFSDALAQSPPDEYPVLRRTSSETLGGVVYPASAKRVMSEAVVKAHQPGQFPPQSSESDSESDSWTNGDDDDPWIVQAVKELTQKKKKEDSPLVVRKPTRKVASVSKPTNIKQQEAGDHAQQETDMGFILMNPTISSSSSSESFEGFNSSTAESFYHCLRKVPKLNSQTPSSKESSTHACTAEETLQKHEENFAEISAWMDGLGI